MCVFVYVGVWWLSVMSGNQTVLNFSLIGPESKTEIGVSSCLLTPTASPRDSGMSEERGINGGVSIEG